MSSVESRVSEQSLGELFGQLSSNRSALMRDEMELAKVELKEEVSGEPDALVVCLVVLR
jgi:hypothetical protein